jgi:hypothetical protein
MATHPGTEPHPSGRVIISPRGKFHVLVRVFPCVLFHSSLPPSLRSEFSSHLHSSFSVRPPSTSIQPLPILSAFSPWQILSLTCSVSTCAASHILHAPLLWRRPPPHLSHTQFSHTHIQHNTEHTRQPSLFQHVFY